MRRLIGRDAELAQAKSFLESSRRQLVARVLRVAGESGIGKSAFADALCADSTAKGWACALVPAHRIQANLSLVVARRAAKAILAPLGEGAARYTSGIEAELGQPTPVSDLHQTSMESGLFHLLDAVLLDRPVLIMVDDAQWADAESCALFMRLVRAFADRPLVFAPIERTDEITEHAHDGDDTILLGELDLDSTKELARDLLPGASESIVASLADLVRGRAIDLVAIANGVADSSTMTEDAFAATVRATISRAVALLNPPMREFLQICSLIGEPIEYPVLRALWEDESFVGFIEAASGRYLIQRNDGLHFAHSSVAQSIRETVAIEIPYRKRIIKALINAPFLTTSQYEQLVEQAAACGDSELEREFLMRLVEEAQRAHALPLVANALTRAIALTPFNVSESLALYLRLSMVHLALNREADCIAASSDALDRAASVGIRDGLGPLVSTLLFALWHAGDRNDFERTYERYDGYLTDPNDRAVLLSVRLYADYADNDRVSFQADRTAIDVLGIASPMLEVRITAFEGMMEVREGNCDLARRSFNRARSVDAIPQALKTMIAACEAIGAFYEYGAGHESVSRALETLPSRDTLRVSVDAIELLASGAAGDAIELAGESLLFEDGRFHRRVIVGIAGSAAALCALELPEQMRTLLESEAEVALRGFNANALLPISAAAAYGLADSDRERATALIDRACESARKPVEPQIFWMPVVLAFAAWRAKHEHALRVIAAGDLASDSAAWPKFQNNLARHAARAALGERISEAEMRELRNTATILGAPFFIEAVNRIAPVANAPSLIAGALLGPKLTRREREVVGLIADGATNRDIATTLVLSERTVEGHVANIFGKLDVGSRSQIAAWHVRNAMAR